MSDPNNPAPTHVRRRASAFGSARVSFDITAQIGVSDVQTLRPAWTESQCQNFLRHHGDAIGQKMVSAGANALAAILKGGGHAR